MEPQAPQHVSEPVPGIVRPACADGPAKPGVVRRTGGAPRGNQNGTVHGLKGFGWPTGCQRDRRLVDKFKAAVTAHVLATGTVDIVAAGLIETAARWERHCRLAARWLRIEGPSLPVAERLNLSREVARGSTERDKALEKLGLKPAQHAASDPWAHVDALLAQPEPNEPTSTEDAA